MKQDMRNNGGPANRVLNQLAAEKKKVVIAFFLIAMMVFMWVKVLSGKGPQSAKAMGLTPKLTNEKQETELEISFVELPKVLGRNDVLGQNFFTVSSWKEFVAEDNREVNVVSGNGGEEAAKRAAEKLKFEAIVSGETPRAFIEDELVAVGDKLSVSDGKSKYEFEVTVISEKTVHLKYDELEIVLKMSEDQ